MKVEGTALPATISCVRRQLTGLLATAPIAISIAASQGAKRVVSIDWTTSECMLELGSPPLGMAEIEGYNRWVVAPSAPSNVIDVGLRVEPNIELLLMLRPDLILITPQISGISGVLSRVATTRALSIYTDDGDPLENAEIAINDLASWIGQKPTSSLVLARARREFSDLRVSASAFCKRSPFLVFQFIDDLHIRVYGRASLFDSVLHRAGLTNAWVGSTRAFGFDVLELAQLRRFRSAIFVRVGPTPYRLNDRLGQNPIWREILASSSGRVINLPSIWPFGGLASARRFAILLSAAVLQSRRR